jgi:hypothetical protein
MPLENRKLKTGTLLYARYKGTERTCEVVQTADGLRYRLDDGREFASPSSAGKAAMDDVSCNGWKFWSIKGTARTKREPKADEPAKAKRTLGQTLPVKSRAAAKASSKRKGKPVRASRRAIVERSGA